MFPVGEFDRVTSGWIERGFLKRRNGQREHELKLPIQYREMNCAYYEKFPSRTSSRASISCCPWRLSSQQAMASSRGFLRSLLKKELPRGQKRLPGAVASWGSLVKASNLRQAIPELRQLPKWEGWS